MRPERHRGGGGAVAGCCRWGGCGPCALGRHLAADPEGRVRCPPVEAQGFAPLASHPSVPGDTCPERLAVSRAGRARGESVRRHLLRQSPAAGGPRGRAEAVALSWLPPGPVPAAG